MQTAIITTKLCKLSSFLHHASEEFENASSHIKEKKIKMSVRNVVMKIKQYRQELNSQIAMLNVKCSTTRTKNEKTSVLDKNALSDKKIIEVCSNSEPFFSNAYNSILNEHLPFKPLRDMLRYQFTGIRVAFRQLQLLKSVMTSKDIEVAVK